MIKLIRGKKPSQLTKAREKKLTDDFITNRRAVWNKKYIKEKLLEFSFNKCCFCETALVGVSIYMEVEHFRNKNHYPKDVVKWNNLLPSCKRCNLTKGSHDVKIEPIIDPTIIDPKQHLSQEYFRIVPKDDLGRMTISTLGLNDNKLCIDRFLLGNSLKEEFEKLNVKANNYLKGITPDTITKNSIVNGTKSLLKQGLPKSIYSAVTASFILSDKEYQKLKHNIINMGFWDSELSDLESEISKIAL